ncbi:MAG: cysteine desulfurase [Lachnospiraceae bacterium]|nr:cysteine desulfurase [Lachnospiraceae bacterium]
MESEKMIYLDNAATTRMSDKVANAMRKYMVEDYYNPSAIYENAYKCMKVVENSKEIIAGAINCSSDEIYITSGGTESDNWVLKGVANAYKDKGNHIIVSKIEHHAILNTCKYLEEMGYDVTYLNVDENGCVNLNELKSAIKKETILISIMYANNEVGTLQPIEQIGQIAKRYNILFHTDAVQAFGHIPIDVNRLNIDMLSASSHKFGGPKGVGFLYVKNGLKMKPLIHGGSQENGMRGGTTNVSGIVGMAEAIKDSMINMRARMAYEIRLRDYMINRILREIPFCKLNGDRFKRLPNNINIGFKNVEGHSIIALLSDEEICASTGSACSSGDNDASHVLKAMRIQKDFLQGAVRFTISHENTKGEIDIVVNKLKEIIYKLRENVI